jgi:carboxylate-amine ligase
MTSAAPTVGVEEEFLLLDPVTKRPVPVGAAVTAAASGGDWGVDVHQEFSPVQIEMATRPCRDLTELRGQLGLGRSRLADAARAAGARLIASGTPPIGDPGPPPITDDPRYGRMALAYGALIENQGVCGCHVHVYVPNPERAVQVCNHLRPWLPVLLALGANSPFMHGTDTGHASWRSLVWWRWPISGVPPYLRSARQYESLVLSLIDAGVIVDRRMIYWYARPSSRFPTVEVRVADVAATVDESVVLAGLIRALVTTADAAIQADRPAPRLSEPFARAASWRAARDGLDGWGIDLRTGELVPAPRLVDHLVHHVTPAMERNGDLDTVLAGLKRLRDRGSAAERQRRAFRRRGEIIDVVDFLAEQTTSFLAEPMGAAQPAGGGC